MIRFFFFLFRILNYNFLFLLIFQRLRAPLRNLYLSPRILLTFLNHFLLIFHHILARLYFLNSRIWLLNLNLSYAILNSVLIIVHTLIYIFVFTISVAHLLLCILLRYLPLRKFLLRANWYFLIILNCAMIVVSILIAPVLTLIQKTSFISAIDWSMGAFHVSLLLLLLRLIWLTFVFLHVPHFGKLRFFNFVLLFSRFWFLFIFFFAFFVHCFFLLFQALTWIIFFQFFIGLLVQYFLRIIDLSLGFLISGFWILTFLSFCFRCGFFNFFSFFFLHLRRLISARLLFLVSEIF